MIVLQSQFFRFASVGAIATATQYVILYALVSGAAWDPAHASMIGAAIGALVNYWLNYTFSFRSDRRHRESFPLFLLMASCGTVLNGLIVKGLTLAGLYYMFAQVVATIVVLGFNFYVSRKWIFVQTR
jgi:putative flippase GtrA